jgi:hypothetical protein
MSEYHDEDLINQIYRASVAKVKQEMPIEPRTVEEAEEPDDVRPFMVLVPEGCNIFQYERLRAITFYYAKGQKTHFEARTELESVCQLIEQQAANEEIMDLMSYERATDFDNEIWDQIVQVLDDA